MIEEKYYNAMMTSITRKRNSGERLSNHEILYDMNRWRNSLDRGVELVKKQLEEKIKDFPNQVMHIFSYDFFEKRKGKNNIPTFSSYELDLLDEFFLEYIKEYISLAYEEGIRDCELYELINTSIKKHWGFNCFIYSIRKIDYRYKFVKEIKANFIIDIPF